MRAITVRECSCDDPNTCSQACGSEMVDRLYVEALVTDQMVERGAEVYYDAETEVGGGDPPWPHANERVRNEYRKAARVVLAAALEGQQP